MLAFKQGNKETLMTISIGIAGLGRVGRSILRTNFLKSPGGRFDVKMICDVMTIDQIAYLLEHDSTYGKPPYSVECQNDCIMINDKAIHYVQVDRRQSAVQKNLDAIKQYNLE